MLAITWSLAYIMCKQQIDKNEKCRQIAGDFDCHADAAAGCGAHCPMEHILGFTWSHWMPPSSEWLHRIAAVAAMADDFSQKNKTLTKTYFCKPYGRPKPKAIRISYPKLDPLLSSSIKQTPRLELKSLAKFLCIKRYGASMGGPKTLIA